VSLPRTTVVVVHNRKIKQTFAIKPMVLNLPSAESDSRMALDKDVYVGFIERRCGENGESGESERQEKSFSIFF
jgi:hypothetical protein